MAGADLDVDVDFRTLMSTFSFFSLAGRPDADVDVDFRPDVDMFFLFFFLAGRLATPMLARKSKENQGVWMILEVFA